MFAGITSRIRGDTPSASTAATFVDNAPSWEELESHVAAMRLRLDIPGAHPESGPTNLKALKRTFGSTEPPRVHLYRDSAAWCPYCEKIVLQLEEKRIPYTVEKINMRCYGDKPKSFTDKVPGGMLPVAEIDGRLLTESAVIASTLESTFPNHTPLMPAPGTAERKVADGLLRLERALFSAWMTWITSSRGDSANQATFVATLDQVDASLGSTPGPYFLGEKLSLVDITYAPFLERMAASVLYYKGLRIEGNGGSRWVALDAWFRAMSTRDTFRHIKSDYYTHAHDLPPQLGGCASNAASASHAAAIDGTDGVSWHLPLPPLSAVSSATEPHWNSSGGENAEADRLEAAEGLISNHTAVTRFAARGCGTRGTRPVSAPLSDPTATPGVMHIDAVDAALRRVAAKLVLGDDDNGAHTVRSDAVARQAAPAVDACAYLRDRVGVPRDMHFPAARQLRAHLNWFIDTAV